MHKLSGAAVAVIMGVALYFTLAGDYDGLRVLTSPSYGLDASGDRNSFLPSAAFSA